MTDMKPFCPWWKSPKGIAIFIMLAALGLYLIIVHQEHVLGALPFLIILLCPLSHLFMHKGHKHITRIRHNVFPDKNSRP